VSGQQHAPAALYLREKKPGIHFTEDWAGPRGRSGRTENLVPTGIRSRTVQPVAQSLYRLSYRAHVLKQVIWNNQNINTKRKDVYIYLNVRKLARDFLTLANKVKYKSLQYSKYIFLEVGSSGVKVLFVMRVV
jgi:hypothetical protein